MVDANRQNRKTPEDDKSLSQQLESGLYLVATPIGNLRDITLRALDVLEHADLILAEDTRHSRRLLDRYAINTRMRPYHEHNADKVRDGILSDLQAGKAIALISDAGTPLVSDPGFKLVRAVAKAGLNVIPIPGASAVITALCASGLPSDRFLFAGFTPPKQQARRRFFSEFLQVPATLIFFEAPNRLLASLADMVQVFADRPAVLARELTKIHETLLRQ
ncbi:16S rRNA (cytidine(1402)-2'-O)-methyltransferase, partial [hydrothermal vent metagenome]